MQPGHAGYGFLYLFDCVRQFSTENYTLQAFWSNYFYLGTQMAAIADRIKEERQRLGLSQEKFGGIAGVSKQTVIAWEKGSTSPTAVQLTELAAQGFDAMRVLTGGRSRECRSGETQDDSGSYRKISAGQPETPLNGIEATVLNCMRQLSPEYQEILRGIVESMVKTQSDRQAIKDYASEGDKKRQGDDWWPE